VWLNEFCGKEIMENFYFIITQINQVNKDLLDEKID
jgi:hypothetical protein